jgi:hypothetical protein
MQVKGPRDLPDFRLWLMDQWRANATFDQMAQKQTVEVILGEPIVNIDPRVQRDLLPKAELWWVTEDMTKLVDHSSKTLPETTLTRDLLPADQGLVLFAESLMGSQSDSGEPITTDAMTWTVASYPRTNETGVSIMSYHVIHVGDEMGNANYGYYTSDREFWSPTGTTTWVFGKNTEAILFEGFKDDAVRSDSHAEDRRWLAATWLLASQPVTSSTTQHADRNVAKRSRRKDVVSDVRIVDLRPRVRPESAESAEDANDDRPRKEHDYRWLVAGPNGDGFWRQQACGPNHSERRPKWIWPYEAGPKDKPLKVRDTVRVLRGNPPPDGEIRGDTATSV